MYSYSKDEVLKRCEEEIACPELFYSKALVNWTSCVNDEDDKITPCTEIIAGFLCEKENIERIKNIEKSARENFNTDHNTIVDFNSPRKEENIAKGLLGLSKEIGGFDYIGKIIAYQIPLKANLKDPKGKIDLLSYRENDKTAVVLELKKPVTDETMLRCVLEAYTYKQMLPLENLKKSIKELEDCQEIVACPLVFKGEESRPYVEYLEMKAGKRPLLKKLMNEVLHVKPYFIEVNRIKIVDD